MPDIDKSAITNFGVTLADVDKVKLIPGNLQWEVWETRIDAKATEPYAWRIAAYKDRVAAESTLRGLATLGGYTNYFMRDAHTGRRYRLDQVL